MHKANLYAQQIPPVLNYRVLCSLSACLSTIFLSCLITYPSFDIDNISKFLPMAHPRSTSRGSNALVAVSLVAIKPARLNSNKLSWRRRNDYLKFVRKRDAKRGRREKRLRKIRKEERRHARSDTERRDAAKARRIQAHPALTDTDYNKFKPESTGEDDHAVPKPITTKPEVKNQSEDSDVAFSESSKLNSKDTP